MVPLQTYIENIKKKTGKTPEEFKQLAIEKGFFQDDTMKATIKAAEVITWLKKDIGLGHGHSLAIYHILKGTVDMPHR